MTKELSNKEVAEFLRQHDDYLIINHRRPDGDAVGCGAALCLCLREMGKNAAIWKNPETTGRYLPYLEGLETECVPENATLVSVDMATEGLLPLNGEHLAGKIQLSIDHHMSNEGYAVFTDVHPECAACGEVLLEIMEMLLPQLTVPMAEALYLAISTDTGCFQYSNVTASTLYAAARLKEMGADTFPINKIMFGTKSIGRLRMEAAMTEAMEFYAGGIVGLSTITLEDMERIGLTEDDMDDISGFPRGVEGVEISVVIKELQHGGAKVSLRTGGPYNASQICAALGGGGHKAAAGASDAGGVAVLKEKILKAIEDYGVKL